MIQTLLDLEEVENQIQTMMDYWQGAYIEI